MPCPVREGQPYYVDKPAIVITRLPQELSGVRDKGEGKVGGETGGGGGGRGVMLTGIMTHSKDRGLNGVRAFLTFTLDKPAVVRACCFVYAPVRERSRRAHTSSLCPKFVHEACFVSFTLGSEFYDTGALRKASASRNQYLDAVP